MNQPHPSGILTFLFTDLENSTPLWEQFPDAMKAAVARHDALLRRGIEGHGGRVVKTTGDGFHAVFENPSHAVDAALAAQQALMAGPWPEATGLLKVRMGLHTGESDERDGDYYGSAVNVAVRIMGLGHGGQVLLSEATAALVKNHPLPDCTLSDLGEHRLKGIAAPQRIFQLCHPELTATFPPLRSLATFKHNLPRQLSSFVGRERELAEIKRLLPGTQLLTLLGPGGTGKTRLMLQAAEEVIEAYTDGVWLVELAPLTDPNLIAERTAAALNVQQQPGRGVIDTVSDYLRHKELLLLLDNVEHLVQPAAAFTERLLEHCPTLTVLVTGREALFIAGETTVQIPSLSLPKEQQSLADVGQSEGVQLFLERARAVRPDYALTEHNCAIIAEVVRRLDGIPLALELAAARLRMLTIEKISERLGDRFRLLTGGRRTALPRQQTLQALIDWSWQLLEQKERTLLGRLSVFSGGWNLEAAEAICGFDPLDEADVFDHLNQLINKSLVIVSEADGEPRYRMLESIRQFAQDRLIETGEGETARDRHAEYFVDFALEAEQHLPRSTMMPWVKRIVQELDNLRVVLAWTSDDRPELALRLSGALLYNWAFFVHPSEGRTWLETAIEKTRPRLADDPPPTLRRDFIKALHGLGIVQSLFGETYAAVDTLQAAINLARESGELELMTYAIAWQANIISVFRLEVPPGLEENVERALEISHQHGFIYSEGLLKLGLFYRLANQGNFIGAMPYFQRVVELAKALNNPRSNANLMQIQARMAALKGEVDAAEALYLRSIDEFLAINDLRNVLHSRSDLAHVYRRTGNIQAALPLYRETIRRWQEEGSQPAVAHQLECFAYLAMALGKPEPAVRLLGRARATREALNSLSTDPAEVAEWQQAMARLADELGDAERDHGIAEGARMSVDEAVALALQLTGEGTCASLTTR